jgi:FkbM family methyltransferase
MAGSLASTVASAGLRSGCAAVRLLPESASRDALMRWLLSFRPRLHPRGGSDLRQVQFADGRTLEVNVCEQVGADLYYGVGFEEVETRLVQRLVAPGAEVFDVGANIGYYATLFAQLAGEKGRVHAFEPAPSTHAQLAANVGRNGLKNVALNQAAVSDAAGEMNLYLNRESALASLGQTGRGKTVGTASVRVVTLDDYARERNIAAIDFLKIDVEGYEPKVLAGARELLRRSPEVVVMCELAAKNFRPLGFSVAETLTFLRGLGFAAWEIVLESPARLRLVETITGEFANQNFLFAHRGSRRAAEIGCLLTAAP